MTKYSILVPTYNEHDNLPLCVYMINKYMKDYDYEIVVVDDKSEDGTRDVCIQLQQVYPGKIVLLERPGKLGLGTAYIDGLAKTTGEFVFIMDCDLSHYPKDLPKFIKKQKEGDFDVVSGTRYSFGGGVSGWNTKRKTISSGANILARTFLAPRQFSDLTGSYRLYRRDVLKTLISEGELPKGFCFQMAIAVKAEKLNYKVGEVPIAFVDRLFGESKMSTGEMIGFLKGMCKLFFWVP